MTQPANRLTTTLTHAITVFGPYDLYILVVSVASLAILAVDSLLTLTPEAHGVRDEMASLRLELVTWRVGCEPPQV